MNTDDRIQWLGNESAASPDCILYPVICILFLYPVPPCRVSGALLICPEAQTEEEAEHTNEEEY